MKKLYCLVVLVMSFVTQAQIVNIPDANFKAKLLSAGSLINQFASTETPVYNPLTNSWTVSNYHNIDTNNDGEIQVSEALVIKYLKVNSANISSLEGIEEFSNLLHLICFANQISNFNIQSLTNLEFLNCGNIGITSLDVSNNTALKFIVCSYNQIETLDLQSLPNLQYLYCNNNQLTNLNIQGLSNLIDVDCYSNQLAVLNLQGLSSLENLDCHLNQITSLDAQQCTNLLNLICNNNQLTSLNAQGLLNLQYLYCVSNLLANLNVQGCSNLEILHCNNNQLTNLELNNNTLLNGLNCDNNQLSSLFIKNNFLDWDNSPVGTGTGLSLSFSNNPNLQYICADEEDLAMVQQKITSYGYTNCHVNSYCSFTPNGTFYTIEGDTKFDLNNNGCDISDIDFPNLNFTIADGTNSGAFISNTSGNYSIPVQAGSHTITPVLENPTYFNISPTSFVADFPTQTSPLNQDFCVTPNGVHHDVEVTIIPTNPARPGFDANYTIIYKNKGNQVENGTVTLDFNDAVLDLVSANPSFSVQGTNSMSWNYTNLQPFETRTIDLVFNVNSPTETQAVNIGDILNYTTSITPLTTDEFISDNTSTLNQTVVGSYDPNDKTCIEGTTVGPDMIGQYVHYVIRFENTGTYAAENVVVKDMIDLAKFDVSTLIPLHSSHDFVTRIAGNKVEFIFEGINLPFDDANNDGYIAFKIKTKPNLVVGDTFSNNASIYFDYNFPIITNTYTTTIAALNTTDFDFGTHFTLYPNPVKEVLNFQSKDNTTINSIEIYNTLGQIVLAVPNTISTVDVSSLQSGNYFVKVNTDLGISNTKFIKE